MGDKGLMKFYHGLELYYTKVGNHVIFLSRRYRIVSVVLIPVKNLFLL